MGRWIDEVFEVRPWMFRVVMERALLFLAVICFVSFVLVAVLFHLVCGGGEGLVFGGEGGGDAEGDFSD